MGKSLQPLKLDGGGLGFLTQPGQSIGHSPARQVSQPGKRAAAGDGCFAYSVFYIRSTLPSIRPRSSLSTMPITLPAARLQQT